MCQGLSAKGGEGEEEQAKPSWLYLWPDRELQIVWINRKNNNNAVKKT